MDKQSARSTGLRNRASLSIEDRAEFSHQIFLHVLPELEQADIISCFVSMRDEVSTAEMLDWCFSHQKTVAVPKTLKHTLEFHVIHSRDDLKPGVFGVLEPEGGEILSPDQFDLILVPLSAFDAQGHRTGYGKGYYDSILSHCQKKIGLAFSCQCMSSIEPDPWDVPLDHVVTEKGKLK